MDQIEVDQKAYFRDELKRKLNDKNNFLIETDRAVVVKCDFPKSQYHFRVVVKEDLKDITELTEEHLPLLDHMMELANQIIEQQDHVQSRNFRIGFKVHTFWNRLNLHVLSDDFYSMAMKRARHWNSFNTELFIPFQMVHMLLGLHGSIDPISDEKYNELLHQKPLNCNQCAFSTDLLLDLKAHLYQHWQLKEGERDKKKKLDQIIALLDEQKLNDEDLSLVKLDDEAAGTSQTKPQVKAEKETEGVPTQAPLPPENSWFGPLVNMMNQVNPSNPFRNTPPLNINSLNPAPRYISNYRHPTFNQNKMPGLHGPRAPWNGPRFPPNPNWQPPNIKQAGLNGFATGPPMQGYPQYQPSGVGGYGRTGPPNSVRPKWVQKTQNKANFQYQNNQNPNKAEQERNLQGPSQQISQQQKPLTQQQSQGAYPKQQRRPNMNPQNRQHPPNPNQNPQNRQNSNPNNSPNHNSQNHQNPNKKKYKNKKPANQNPQQSSSTPQSQGIQAAQLPSHAKPAGGS